MARPELAVAARHRRRRATARTPSQAQLPDVVTIQQNTRVRVADVNVGNVTKIEVQDWHALVTMRIDGDVHLPANSTAKVGQTSLLGSMHIELAPPTDEPPQGELKDGSVIPLSAASTYPTTEQTLASVSILLNGGGLGQLQEINQAFAKALAGPRGRHAQPAHPAGHCSSRSSTTRPTTSSPPPRVSTRWSGRSPRKDQTVDQALTTIPQALAVLADRATKLADAIDALGKFSAIATSHGRPDQGVAGRQPAQHRAGAARTRRRRAGAHQGTGLPVDLPVGEKHRPQLVPRRLRQHHPGHRPDPEPDRQQACSPAPGGRAT